MLDAFALGFICGSIIVGIIWLSFARQEVVVYVNDSEKGKVVSGGSKPSKKVSKPDPEKALRYRDPSYIAQKEEQILKRQKTPPEVR